MPTGVVSGGVYGLDGVRVNLVTPEEVVDCRGM